VSPERRVARLAGAAVLIAAVGLYVLARVFDVRSALAATLDWVGALGPLGPVIFVVLYVAVTVLLLPAIVLTLGGGAVFGLARGAVLVWLGATLGATVAFIVGRYLTRGWVERRLERHTTLRALDEAVARGGWKIVALTRLSPVFPFVVLNYVYGATRVSLRQFVPATAVGMIPGITGYVYIGALAGSVVTGTRVHTPVQWALYVLGLLATVAATIYVTRLARAALRRSLPA